MLSRLARFARTAVAAAPRVAQCNTLHAAKALSTPSLHLRSFQTSPVSLGDVPPLDAPYDVSTLSTCVYTCIPFVFVP